MVLTAWDMMQLEVDAVAEASPEEEVEHQIQLSRRAKGRTNVVQGRGLQQGDLCMVKFEARHLDSDTIMPRTAHERMQIDSNIPEQIPMPGVLASVLPGPDMCGACCWGAHLQAHHLWLASLRSL